MTILRSLLAVGVLALVATPAYVHAQSKSATVCRDESKSEKICVTATVTRKESQYEKSDVAVETTSNSKKDEWVIWTMISAEGRTSQGALTVKPGQQKHTIPGHNVSYGPIKSLSLKFAF